MVPHLLPSSGHDDLPGSQSSGLLWRGASPVPPACGRSAPGARMRRAGAQRRPIQSPTRHVTVSQLSAAALSGLRTVCGVHYTQLHSVQIRPFESPDHHHGGLSTCPHPCSLDVTCASPDQLATLKAPPAPFCCCRCHIRCLASLLPNPLPQNDTTPHARVNSACGPWAGIR